MGKWEHPGDNWKRKKGRVYNDRRYYKVADWQQNRKGSKCWKLGACLFDWRLTGNAAYHSPCWCLMMSHSHILSKYRFASRTVVLGNTPKFNTSLLIPMTEKFHQSVWWVSDEALLFYLCLVGEQSQEMIKGRLNNVSSFLHNTSKTDSGLVVSQTMVLKVTLLQLVLYWNESGRVWHYFRAKGQLQTAVR